MREKIHMVVVIAFDRKRRLIEDDPNIFQRSVLDAEFGFVAVESLREDILHHEGERPRLFFRLCWSVRPPCVESIFIGVKELTVSQLPQETGGGVVIFWEFADHGAHTVVNGGERIERRVKVAQNPLGELGDMSDCCEMGRSGWNHGTDLFRERLLITFRLEHISQPPASLQRDEQHLCLVVLDV